MAPLALLLMDFQARIVGRLAERATPAVAAAARAADGARAHGVPCYFVRVAFRPGVPEVSARNRLFSAVTQDGGFAETDPGAAIDPRLRRRDDEPIVTKRRVSAFAGSDLDVLLRARGIDALVLGGLSTSGVVLSTVRQASDLDLGLTVLSDACADPDDEVHRVLLEKVLARQATVRTVDDWVASLAPGATPTT